MQDNVLLDTIEERAIYVISKKTRLLIDLFAEEIKLDVCLFPIEKY